jgi:hypothetical protein
MSFPRPSVNLSADAAIGSAFEAFELNQHVEVVSVKELAFVLVTLSLQCHTGPLPDLFLVYLLLHIVSSGFKNVFDSFLGFGPSMTTAVFGYIANWGV